MAKKTYSAIAEILKIKEVSLASFWNIPSKKSEANDVRAYKKTTLSITILLVLLKKTKNKTKGESCANKAMILIIIKVC